MFAVAGVKPVGIGLIQTTDISFPLNRKGSCKPLKTLWGSTMGVQSPSTEPSEQTDPRKAHQTAIFGWKGFRMTPLNTSDCDMLMLPTNAFNGFPYREASWPTSIILS